MRASVPLMNADLLKSRQRMLLYDRVYIHNIISLTQLQELALAISVH